MSTKHTYTLKTAFCTALFVLFSLQNVTTVLSYGKVTFVGPSQNGNLQNSGNMSSISSDGKYIAFESDANNLITNDTNNARDIFVKELATGTTIRVSTANDGSQLTFGGLHPSISVNNGIMRVAFVGFVRPGRPDVLVKELSVLNLSPIRTINATEVGNGGGASSRQPKISSDGRYVVFVSISNDFALDTNGNPTIDTNSATDVYRRDLQQTLPSLSFALVSITTGGVAGNGSSEHPSISADGRYVTFDSRASNLVFNDANNRRDVFMRDMQSGLTHLVSVATNGNQGNENSGNPLSDMANYGSDVSDDGRFVVFTSFASNFTQNDNNANLDIFLRDRQNQTTSFIGQRNSSGNTLDANARYPNINADGRFATFRYLREVFQFDRQLGTLKKITPPDINGMASNGEFPEISHDGKFITFSSAGRIANEDPSIIYDTYVFDSTAPAQLNTGDFDADGVTDVAVFRPSISTWYSLLSSSNQISSAVNGQSGDKLVPGDYDGDSKTDYAVYRPSDGTWYILKSSDSNFVTQQFGISTDIPVAADYDGDDKTDIAVFRGSGGVGNWYRLNSSNGAFVAIQWGADTDKPVAGDYDRDNKTDVAVYRPSTGAWFIQRSYNSNTLSYSFGATGDTPVQSDYDGDGKTDIAVFRPSNGTWYWQQTSNNNIVGVNFGASTDKLVPGDYDNDGKTDVAVFRPSDGNWYVLRSFDGIISTTNFGASTDLTVPTSYIP